MEAEEAEEMSEEEVELVNLAVLGEDYFGLVMHLIPANDDNSTASENVPESTNQGGAVYNSYLGYYIIKAAP